MRDTELHGETLDYWKANAEEDYMKVPISVLKYITVLEEVQNQRVIGELHNLYNEEEEHNDCISKELIYQRIKELKRD